MRRCQFGMVRHLTHTVTQLMRRLYDRLPTNSPAEGPTVIEFHSTLVFSRAYRIAFRLGLDLDSNVTLGAFAFGLGLGLVPRTSSDWDPRIRQKEFVELVNG